MGVCGTSTPANAPGVIFDADELEQRIIMRQADAALLPCGATRQSVLKEIAQLRAYADMKRLLMHHDAAHSSHDLKF